MATRKRTPKASSKRKPRGAKPKAKRSPRTAKKPADAERPSSDALQQGVGWLLAIAAAYGPAGEFGGLAAHTGQADAAQTPKLVQAAIDAAERLRAHVQQLHRSTFQTSVIADWLKENRDLPDAAEQLGRMLRGFTGKSWKPAQAKALLEAAKGRSLTALPVWLGYAEPLRDENARRAVLRLVTVELLGYSVADYEQLLEVLGLTPEAAAAD
jgi:hypothetical protein